jgi:hypothetical protein
MTTDGWWSGVDGTGTAQTDDEVTLAWIFGSLDNQNPNYDVASSNPKVNTGPLALGCSKDCRAFSDGSNTFKFDDRTFD